MLMGLLMAGLSQNGLSLRGESKGEGEGEGKGEGEAMVKGKRVGGQREGQGHGEGRARPKSTFRASFFWIGAA